MLGILLMALSLRAAVVSVPPLLQRISENIAFTEFTTGLLAMLAPSPSRSSGCSPRG
ncbi:hypothetical protein [Arthrobacter sp. JCM 19049]|uniref:hypothetical protein n=1 Tax=Arthrobacter sp. JCM 19049 TaxID=1460643 RepID=UPI000B224334|nr:hypothetical protein [Arthrobacter sp. JCM 19049]